MGCSFTCSSLAVGLVPSATSRTRLSPACSAAIWRSRQDGQSVKRARVCNLTGKGGRWLALRLAFRSFRLVHVAAEMSRWLHDETGRGRGAPPRVSTSRCRSGEPKLRSSRIRQKGVRITAFHS